jgi:hypothetical protein
LHHYDRKEAAAEVVSKPLRAKAQTLLPGDDRTSSTDSSYVLHVTHSYVCTVYNHAQRRVKADDLPSGFL